MAIVGIQLPVLEPVRNAGLEGLGQTVGTNTYKIAAVKFAKPCWSAWQKSKGRLEPLRYCC